MIFKPRDYILVPTYLLVYIYIGLLYLRREAGYGRLWNTWISIAQIHTFQCCRKLIVRNYTAISATGKGDVGAKRRPRSIEHLTRRRIFAQVQ